MGATVAPTTEPTAAPRPGGVARFPTIRPMVAPGRGVMVPALPQRPTAAPRPGAGARALPQRPAAAPRRGGVAQAPSQGPMAAPRPGVGEASMNPKLFVSGLCRRSAFCLAWVLVSLTATFVAAQGVPPARVLLPTDPTVLPIPEPQYPHSTVLDAWNATPPPRFAVKAPPNAPNVLLVLIDDMGFGQSSAFGGLIHMPTVERLAANGLR